MIQITFQKPQVKELNKLGFNCVDMHFHTKYSDGISKIQSVLKKARKREVGVAITDHNDIRGAIEAYNNRNGVFMVPGIEVTSYEGPDILLYFCNTQELQDYYIKYIKNFKGKDPNGRLKKSFVDLIEPSQNYNCLVSLPHPCGVLWKSIPKFIEKYGHEKKLLEHVDAVEVMNSEQMKKANLNALKLREQWKKAFTGGSDGHSLWELGSTVTFSYEHNLEAFLESIRKKKNYVTGKEVYLPKRVIPHTVALRKHATYMPQTLMEDFKTRVKPKIKYYINKKRVNARQTRLGSAISNWKAYKKTKIFIGNIINKSL